MPNISGKLLRKRYRIESSLGQGGMATVHRAMDTRLDVPVAIKEMIPQPDLKRSVRDMLSKQFLQEAKVLAKLKHPNLVRVTDYFEDAGHTYLVMDYVEGENLDILIQREGRMPESVVLPWAGQLLDALAYCHNNNIIHRDIKPQNVIIRPDGQAMLVDFGLVKLWNPNDPQTQIAMQGMGTPEYAPPEQYDAKMGHTDPRSDIYSLGATLYHALSGGSPPSATIRISDPEQFQHDWTAFEGVSETTQQVIRMALELARTQRWANASAMATALGVSGSSGIAPVGHNVVTTQLTPNKGKTQILNWEDVPTAGQGVAIQPPPPPSPPSPIYEAPADLRKRHRVPIGVWIMVVVLMVLGLATIGYFSGLLPTLAKPEPTATMMPTFTPLPTVTSMPTATAQPTAMPTETPRLPAQPSPVPTLVILEEGGTYPDLILLGPAEDSAWIVGEWIPLRWQWFQRLTEEQRYSLTIANADSELVYETFIEHDAVTTYGLLAGQQSMQPGIYTWSIAVESSIDDEWTLINESNVGSFRIHDNVARDPGPNPAAITPIEGTLGSIVFTVQDGDKYSLYSTDPRWAEMQEIGDTMKTDSTCDGNDSVSSTGSRLPIAMYSTETCEIISSTTICPSPNGSYVAVADFVDEGEWSLSVHTADGTAQIFYYSGIMADSSGLQWSPNSRYVLFGDDTMLNIIEAGQALYTPIARLGTTLSTPLFSPDSAWVVYATAVGAEGGNDIYAVSIDGSELWNLTNKPDVRKLCPRWRK